VERTVKEDWLTNYLFREGFWVGGTHLIDKGDPRTAAVQTIRYFQSEKPGFLVVYILEFIEPHNKDSKYEQFIKSKLEILNLVPDFTLAIWPNQSRFFATLEDQTFRENLSTVEVLQVFSNFDSSMIGKTTNLKPLNRSFTDFFHLWARQNLKGFQNDLDAFIHDQGTIHMLELKRPKESTQTWRPYRADSSNYINFLNFCVQNSYELTNIAYVASEPGKIKVFKDVSVEFQSLRYRSAEFQMEPHEKILNVMRNLEFREEISKR
jgi:hypothetical protein